MSIEITVFGIVAGLLLLAVPLFIMHFYGVGMVRKSLVSMLRMAVSLGLTGVFLEFMYRYDNPWLNLLWIVIMVGIGSFVVVVRGRMRRRSMIVPVFAGLLSAVLLCGLFFLFAVLGLRRPFAFSCFVPLLGFVAGSLVDINAKSLAIYYSGLAHHGRLYTWFVANGATHSEAVKYFFRRALQRSAIPNIARMGGIMIVQTPVLMWMMQFSGANVAESIAFQVFCMLLLFASSMLSTLVTLLFARRYSFDEYGRIRR